MSRLELESKYEELIAKYSKGDFLGKKFDRKNMYSDRRGVFHEDGSEVKRYETCTLCMKAPERGKPFKRCSGCVDGDGDGTPYCSQKCQQLHWPDHKLRCKSKQQTNQKLKDLQLLTDARDKLTKIFGPGFLDDLPETPAIFLRGKEFKSWTEMFSWTWIRSAHRGIYNQYGSGKFDFEDTVLMIKCKSRPQSETASNPALFADIESAEFLSISALPRPQWDSFFDSMKVMESKKKRIGQIASASSGSTHRGVLWFIFLVDEVLPLVDVHPISTPPTSIYRKMDHSGWIEEMKKYAHNGWVVRRTSDKTNMHAVGTLSRRDTTGIWQWAKLSPSECDKFKVAKEYRNCFQPDLSWKRK